MSLDITLLGTFALLWLAIVPTPGPNTLLIMHLALTASRGHLAAALAGNLLAIAFYATGTLLGLALLLSAAPSVRVAVYLLGGAYMIWVGARLTQAGLAARAVGARADAPTQSTHTGKPFAQGVLTALANVQAVFFLTSIFASTGVLTANAATRAATVGVIVALNGAYLALLAWLLQKEGPRAFYTRNRPVMQIGFGLIFLLFGLRLVWRELGGGL